MIMKNTLLAVTFFLLVFASSCHKCYECKQYCAYCVSTIDSGFSYKICASNDVNHFKVDSLKNAYQSNGYNCSFLEKDKRVCDNANKLNEAVDYYQLQDYYCNPAE